MMHLGPINKNHSGRRKWQIGAIGLILGPLVVPVDAQCQMGKLLANDGGAVDLLGESVAVSGPFAMAGARRHAHNYPGSGGLYVFEPIADGWTLTAELTFLPGEGASFGNSVALDGAVGVVGAVGYWPSVVVFQDGFWGRLQFLRPIGPFPHGLGEAVAIQQTRILAGAPDADNENGGRAGSVFVFESDTDGVWRQSAKLVASDGTGGDKFGAALAIHDDMIVVGAPEDSPLGLSSGSAYVFEMNGAGDWIETAKLIPSDHGFLDKFGLGVATDGRTVLVGAYHAPDGAISPGAVYVFERDGAGAWGEIQKLTPPNGQNSDFFGVSLAMEDDLAIVGAENYELDGTNVGALFMYHRQPDSLWRQIGLLRASDPEREAEFGRNVALSGNLAVVGAPYKDGVDAAGHPVADSGAAYVFAVGPDRDENGVMDVCDCRSAVSAGAGFVGNPDLNLDRVVDLADVVILLSGYGHTRDNPPAGLNLPYAALHEFGDLDLDQDIDLQDLALMLAAYGRSCE